MKQIILLITLLVSLFPQPAFAQNCLDVSLKNKLILKINTIQEKVYLFLLADINKQIEYQLNKADSIYDKASMLSNPSYAYALALKAENHITRIPQLLQQLDSTQSFDIESYERQFLKHQEIIHQMKGVCEWDTVLGFIRSNRATIRNIYFTNLPTDLKLQLY